MNDAANDAAIWTVYIVRTESGKLYTGITNDLQRRVEQHRNDEKRGAKFFRISRPEAVVFSETWSNRSEASKREREIKKLSRPQKLRLIGEMAVCA